MAINPMRNDFSRVFLIEGRAAPNNTPSYQGQGRMGPLSLSFGEPEKIETPDPNAFGKFIEAGSIPGETDRPTTTLQRRYPTGLSDLLRLVRDGCDFDLQAHIGKCRSPADFNFGWDKIVVWEAASASSYETDDLGGMTSGDREPVNEEIEISARDAYEIGRVVAAQRADSLVNSEIVAISVCDTPSCEGCDSISDGCSKIFALAIPVSGSAGINPEVIFSNDGFGTSFGNTDISTMGATDVPSDQACVGSNLVIVENSGDALHYADSDAILAGTESWTQVTTGFVAAGSPNAIVSASPRHTWIAGDGGYIYFTADPTTSVAAQDAGVATSQNLNDIDAFDTELVVAVGASNAIIFTTNGGESWSALTGPAVGVALNAIAIRTEQEWWVGTAGGEIYYTLDQGVTWTAKGFSGSGAGQVRAIVWATDTVGWFVHDSAVPAGNIFRTISGGNTWYIVPEGKTVTPANDRFNALAVCAGDPNTLFVAGLADDGSDGIIVKAEAEKIV